MQLNEYFIIYDVAASMELARNRGPLGSIAAQRPSEGRAVIAIPEQVYEQGLSLDTALDDIRTALWAKTRAIRDRIVVNGASTPFGPIDSDIQSRTNIVGAVVSAQIFKASGDPFEMTWTMADNSTVDLDADDMIALGVAVASHVNTAHAHARTLRDTIGAAEDVSALLQIDVEAGWAAP